MTRDAMLKKLNKKLHKAFGGSVHASEADECLVLTGRLNTWPEVVQAGQMCRHKGVFRGLVNRITLDGETPQPMALPPLADAALEGQSPDVLIIGAGVVGCAIARELSRHQLDILLVDKEHDVAMQTSSRNDGMVHPGLDLKRGSLKHHYNMRGNAMYDQVCQELGVPFQRRGQYLCFTSKMPKLLLRLSLPFWRYQGVTGGRVLGRKALRQAEPHLAENLSRALFFPTAGCVCPYGLAIAYGENAIQNGARFLPDTAITGMEVKAGTIHSVQTNRGTLFPRLVINAAGVFSDQVAAMAGDGFFTIHPRKGTNIILDAKATGKVVNSIASVIGQASKSSHTKGGGIVRTAHGNLLVGPDAVEIPEREDFSTRRESVHATLSKQKHTSPSLTERDVITYFSGTRASTYEEDFIIQKSDRVHNLIHGAGIQSPGLTAAPAIAVDIAKMAVEQLSLEKPVSPNPNFSPIRTPIPPLRDLPLKERDALIGQNPDYGIILCRCEEISKGEILDALRRPLPCDTVDGVKRRVRPGMGRCQGGFCGPLVAGLIAQEKGIPLEAVQKSGLGSPILLGSTKEGCI